jgi:hypothetical protein
METFDAYQEEFHALTDKLRMLLNSKQLDEVDEVLKQASQIMVARIILS